ncbi:MAG: hypothetical protein U0359_05505 [Byssovorax sp.]
MRTKGATSSPHIWQAGEPAPSCTHLADAALIISGVVFWHIVSGSAAASARVTALSSGVHFLIAPQ